MSLQLTPFDPYAVRPAVPPPTDPPAVAPAASVAAGSAAPGDGTSERSAPESSAGAAQAARAQRAAGAGRPAGAAVDPDAVPSTVSLGKPPAPPAEAAAGQVPVKPEPPVSEQMLEFLQSMWKAGAQAITLPRDEDGVPGPDAVTAAGTVEAAGDARPTMPGVPGAPAAGDGAAARQAADPPGARPAVVPVRSGEPPILGNALDDGLPAVAAPSAAPLVYADPTLRRASGR